jgi:RNA polymerase sigma factor (sigma-70 family)
MAHSPAAYRRTRAGSAAASPASWFGHDLPDWNMIWAGCWRRIRSWPRPPRWSAADWRDETLAQGAVAAWQALLNYDATRAVPLSAFVHQRVIADARTLHRQEWAYALHLDLNAGAERCECVTESQHLAADAHDAVTAALTQLEEGDHRLIAHLYLKGWTEAEVAENLGMNQGTINRRKRSVLLDLRRSLRTASKNQE